MLSTAQTIKKIRLSMCLEQDEFAKLLDLTKSAVCNYERGVRNPRLNTVRKLKQLAKENGMDVSTEDFLN